MNLFTKQKQIHNFENKLMVTKGEMWYGWGKIRSLGLTYTHYCI